VHHGVHAAARGVWQEPLLTSDAGALHVDGRCRQVDGTMLRRGARGRPCSYDTIIASLKASLYSFDTETTCEALAMRTGAAQTGTLGSSHAPNYARRTMIDR
jgi:hypothetical protein